jgi:ATPase subunit of ABC transporter with duplicated ATPase domains
MPATDPAFVTCSALSFRWPDGTQVLSDLELTVGAGVSGIIGANGSGKSTLLRLIAGELAPTGGSVTVAGDVGRLPQRVVADARATVTDLLGLRPVRDALRAIESGSVDEADFAAVGDDWDVEDRARGALAGLGITGPDVLDRPAATLSGGEATLSALARLLLHPPAVTMLDEPTNNLDRAAREALYRTVADWPGVLLVVSHDRELLGVVDRIVELRDGRARVYGGAFDDYRDAVRVQEEAAARAVRDAQSDLRVQQRQLIRARTALDRRQRTGRKAEAENRVPRIVAHARKRAAQVSAGKLRTGMEQDVLAAREALDDARAAVRDDALVRIDLPATGLPAGRSVLSVAVPGAVAPLLVRGPERIALLGGNGAGKTTLIRAIAQSGRVGGPVEAGGGLAGVRVHVAEIPVGYLPQRLDVLDDALSVRENVRAENRDATDQQVRALLARFLLGKRAVDRPAGSLSGGERFRAVMARLVLADPAPRLLLLDEPTNNLDLDNVAVLTDAVSGYRGALLVASHDRPFLADLGISRAWRLGESDSGVGIIRLGRGPVEVPHLPWGTGMGDRN